MLDSLPQEAIKAPVVTKKQKAKMVAPSGYLKVTPARVKAVLDRIEAGESERSACKAENVSRSSFRTMALRSGVDDQYARALEMLAQDQVEAMEKTLEDMRTGTIDASMARVEIDARKWFASKFLPKRYGDKLDLTSDGKQLPTPIISIAAAPETKEINS